MWNEESLVHIGSEIVLVDIHSNWPRYVGQQSLCNRTFWNFWWRFTFKMVVLLVWGMCRVAWSDIFTSFEKHLESSSGHTLNFCPNLVNIVSIIRFRWNLSPGLLRWSSLQTKKGPRLKLTCRHINRRHICLNIKSISLHPLLWMNVMLDFICMVFAGMWTTFR